MCWLAPGADPDAGGGQAEAHASTVRPTCQRYVNLKVPASKIMQVQLVPFRDAHLTTDRYFGMKPPGS